MELPENPAFGRSPVPGASTTGGPLRPPGSVPTSDQVLEAALTRLRQWGFVDAALLHQLEVCKKLYPKPLDLLTAAGLPQGLAAFALQLPVTGLPQLEHTITLVAELGSGGMGKVYLGIEHLSNRPVAVKVLRPSRSMDSKAYRRFEQEIKTTARVAHPSCVRVFRVGQGPEGPFVVLEYVRGHTLAEELKRAPEGLEIGRCVSWAIDIAAGLQAAHRCGVVHRDIKPDNILLDASQAIRITDFGIASDALIDGTRLTAHGSSLGTPSYMAPEQWNVQTDTHPSPTCDIYSLGATLYELLTGRPPFKGATNLQAHVAMVLSNAEPDPPSKHRPQVPASLDRILLKCLKLDPDQRYPSAEELIEDLCDVLEHDLGLPRPAASARGTATSSRPSWLPLVTFGLGLLLGFAAALIPQDRDDPPAPTQVAAKTTQPPTPTRAPTPTPDPTPTKPAPPKPERQAPPGLVRLNETEYRNLKDGSVLIWIPPGRFAMGSQDMRDESPVHQVSLSGYFIGKYEVTTKQFLTFCKETGRKPPSRVITRLSDRPFRVDESHPVINVAYQDAVAYCRWAGLQLPTEAQWEYAARGTDGRRWPWGNAFGTFPRGNVADSTAVALRVPRIEATRRGQSWFDGAPYTNPVGGYASGRSPFGCLDMAGNVHEWVRDWYAPYTAQDTRDPTGPGQGKERLIRGGSWSNGDWACRVSARHRIRHDMFSDSLGFRVSRSGPRQ